MKKNIPYKDPKKVAAGKARAAKAIRNTKGQLVSKSFEEELKKISDASGFKGKSLQTFYDQNSTDIDNVIGRKELPPSQNRYSIKTIERLVKKTSKKTWLYKDGETFRASPETISFEMAKFEQYCYTTRNVTGIVWKKMRKGTGDPLVKIPDIDEEIEDMDDIEFIDHCAAYGVIIWISDLSKIKNKNKRFRRQKSKQSKLKNAKAIKKRNKPKHRKRKPPGKRKF